MKLMFCKQDWIKCSYIPRGNEEFQFHLAEYLPSTFLAFHLTIYEYIEHVVHIM